MANIIQPERGTDPLGPPMVSTRVECIECGSEYDSDDIVWRVHRIKPDELMGFWCCPTEQCGGTGFGMDMLPVDPNYRDEYGGWVHDPESDDGIDLDDLDDDVLSKANLRVAGPIPGPDDEVPF